MTLISISSLASMYVFMAPTESRLKHRKTCLTSQGLSPWYTNYHCLQYRQFHGKNTKKLCLFTYLRLKGNFSTRFNAFQPEVNFPKRKLLKKLANQTKVAFVISDCPSVYLFFVPFLHFLYARNILKGCRNERTGFFPKIYKFS